jgi:hypothetical protein
MTDYTKENHWYGHNGGECPVHPETEVHIACISGQHFEGPAKKYAWEHNLSREKFHSDIISFHITRLYREPRPAREWWVNRYYGSPNDDTLFASRAEADSAALDENRIECVHVREVLPEGDA